MEKNLVYVLKSDLGYTLVGEYLRSAYSEGFPSSVPSKSIGISVLGENYDFNQSLVDVTKFNSPVVSCGMLSEMINAAGESLKEVFDKASYIYRNDYSKLTSYMENYNEELKDIYIPVAQGEGADDDELKQDISILLKESKEEFEKRVKENEEEKAAEKDDSVKDKSFDEEPAEEAPTDEPNEEDAMTDDEGQFDGSYDDGSEEEESTEDEESEEETDDSEGDEIPDGNLSEDEEEQSGAIGEAESSRHYGKSKFTKKARRALNEYNAQKPYAEERRFYIKGNFTSIPYPELKDMRNELLKIEEENFVSLGESFDISNMNPNGALSLAHGRFIKAQASVLVFKRKLNLK